MKILLDLPDYDGNALDVIWEKNSACFVDVFDDEIVIRANAEGMISLAKQMLYLASTELPSGSHIHYDEFVSNADKLRYELVLEKL